MSDNAPLGPGWSLWRDFAVRSAGFPVDGLELFGGAAEAERLRAVAGDPRFREAVTWQNPAVVVNALDKVAAGRPAGPSIQRRREETVAAYWQRYCGKNDTIGFFGPLAWGRIVDGGGFDLRGGPLERERAVHLETWGVQALAATIDPALQIAPGPRPEDDLRAALGGNAVGLSALDRLERARDAVAAAPPAALGAALAELDRVFADLTGRAPTRYPGRTYGARTLAYLDCMRDIEVDVGIDLLAEIAPSLQLLFEAGRWFCGRVQAVAEEVIATTLPAGGSVRFGAIAASVSGQVMRPPAPLLDAVAELQDRVRGLVRDPDPSTLAARARRAFADHRPAWRESVFQSVDIQIAAASPAAIATGDYRAVIGDCHPGYNPLVQGLFGSRFPDAERFEAMLARAVGPFEPPAPPLVALQQDVHEPGGARTWPGPGPRLRLRSEDLLVDGWDVVDRSRDLRVPLLEVLALPMFVSCYRAFDPFGGTEHAPRLTVGRTVLRRERWEVPARQVTADDLVAWARDRGMPRRVFVKTTSERKPFLLDFDSPVLCRIAARHIRQAAQASPNGPVRISEMLPGPDVCWLTDDQGRRYTSELRFVAVDEARRQSSGLRLHARHGRVPVRVERGGPLEPVDDEPLGTLPRDLSDPDEPAGRGHVDLGQ